MGSNKITNNDCVKLPSGHNISVCIATYNGARYVAEQVTSILEELQSYDEVIIVDDCSNDNTVRILQNLNDSRIKIYLNNRNMGVNYSFERAISLANNHVLFLSDQDDIWKKGKVLLTVNKLYNTRKSIVFSNTEFVDNVGNIIIYKEYKLKTCDSSKHIKNIMRIFMGRAYYFGCAMAFRKEIVKYILPIPSFVESHDLWIALAGNIIGSIAHIEEKTLFRRIHGNNLSLKKRRIPSIIWSRFIFAISIAVLIFRSYNSSIRKDIYNI